MGPISTKLSFFEKVTVYGRDLDESEVTLDILPGHVDATPPSIQGLVGKGQCRGYRRGQ